ncbi:MAG: ABC transporter permease, partial [Halanaerobiales bacterium]
MIYFLKLAAKNLFRHKLRTLVSILAIAISIMVVVFTRGLIVGFIDSVFSAQIHYQSGHIRIIDRDYEMKEKLLSLNYTVDGWDNGGLEEMVSELQKLEEVEMVLPRVKFGAAATAEDDGELVRMAGWGILPDRERDFTDVEKQLVKGRLPRPGEAEVTMGAGLLSKLGRQVGEKVTVVYNTSY